MSNPPISKNPTISTLISTSGRTTVGSCVIHANKQKFGLYDGVLFGFPLGSEPSGRVIKSLTPTPSRNF